MNDNQNLYMLIQLFYDDYNASTYNFDELDIYFDGNGNGFLDSVEDAKYCLVSSGLEDWHFSTSTAQEDTILNGALGKSHTNPVNGRVGNYTFELRIPLNSTDINDIATRTNNTIGLTIAYIEWREDPEMPGSSGGIKGYYPASKNQPGQFLQYFIIPNVPIMHVNSVNAPANVLVHQSLVLDLNFTNYGAATARNVSIRLLFDGDLLANDSASIINISQIISLETITIEWNLTSKNEKGVTNITIELQSPDFDTVIIYRPLTISSQTSDLRYDNYILSWSIFITIIASFTITIILDIYRIRKKHIQQGGRKTNAKNVSP